MKLLSRARNTSDLWRSLLIALVLIVLPFSSYSVAAAPSWQPFAAGGAGWEVLNEYTNVTYRFNGLERLMYNPRYEQWYQNGQIDAGYWSTLGIQGQSSTFIGDGKEHSIGSGWSYMYNGSNSRRQDSAWFSFNGNYRLAYNYTEGQWWQKGTDWSKVGTAGLSAFFIGDGTARSIGAGWSYMYNGSNVRKQDSAWYSFNGNYRLAYNYTEGQWWQKGIVDWSKLGSSGISTTFIGDGTDRSIGAGWSYMYNGSNARKQDSAWLSYNGSCRLAYNYTEGQWWQKGVVDWSKLGGSGISSTFIGDGTDRSIGDGWSYRYNASNSMKQDSVWFGFNSSYGQASNDNGSFAQSSNNIAYLFAYNYTECQWWHNILGGNLKGFQKLGSDKMSSAFIGDGKSYKIHKLDDVDYRYDGSFGVIQDWGTEWNDDVRVNYNSGQWQMNNPNGNWVDTGWETWEYIGDHKHLGHDFVYYSFFGVKQSTPPTYTLYDPNVECTIWDNTDNRAAKVATWHIYKHGNNMKWDGGKLNVIFISTQAALGLGETTLDDVIVFDQFNLENVGIGKITESLQYVTKAYGKAIDNLCLHEHANSTGGSFGNWVNVNDYLNYQNDFEQWNNYLTDNGQMQLLQCSAGNAPNMLRAIGGWTGTQIFAHDHNVSISDFGKIVLVNLSYPRHSSDVWNYNTTLIGPTNPEDKIYEFTTGTGKINPCFFGWEKQPSSSW